MRGLGDSSELDETAAVTTRQRTTNAHHPHDVMIIHQTIENVRSRRPLSNKLKLD
jgi:hypothetical protein